MLHIVLYQPEIPPNTGNIIRLCANTGAALHLIHPLGFELQEKKLRRAGLDYIEWENVHEYQGFDDLLARMKPKRLFAASTKGYRDHTAAEYRTGDGFIFGPETRGLPVSILEHERIHDVIRIPMKRDSRSLNLSNAASIILYEAWRQTGFAGAE